MKKKIAGKEEEGKEIEKKRQEEKEYFYMYYCENKITWGKYLCSSLETARRRDESDLKAKSNVDYRPKQKIKE